MTREPRRPRALIHAAVEPSFSALSTCSLKGFHIKNVSIALQNMLLEKDLEGMQEPCEAEWLQVGAINSTSSTKNQFCQPATSANVIADETILRVDRRRLFFRLMSRSVDEA